MRFSIFTIALFANLALIASAFAEEPKAADNNTDAELGSSGRCGGAGGNKTETLTCPQGQYIAAMGARGGAFIDEVSIACRAIPVSGEPGPLGPWMSAGPGGGLSSRADKCESGRAVKELSIRSGAYLDNIYEVYCHARSGDGWGHDRKDFWLGVGGPGGIGCGFECPGDEALYQIEVRSGGWVDSIRGYCRR